jgi:hypothetical protein
MGEAFIVRRGGVVSETTAAPTITIISEDPTGVTFTLTNNDDNTAFITYEIDDVLEVIELAAAATSSNITVELDEGTYTLTAYATVVGEVATQSSEEVVIEVIIPTFELLYDSLTADDGDPISLPATQLDITGLNIGKNDELRLVYTLVGDSSTTAVYTLFVNDETTATDYHTQRLFGDGSSLVAARTNDSRFSFGTLDNNVGIVDIKVSNNDRFVAQSYHFFKVGSGASNVGNQNHNIVSSGFTLTSITKLSIVSDRTDGIAAGSRIRLYKVNTGEA